MLDEDEAGRLERLGQAGLDALHLSGDAAGDHELPQTKVLQV